MQSPRMRKFAAILVYRRKPAGRSHKAISLKLSRMPPSSEAVIRHLASLTPSSILCYNLCWLQADLLPFWFNNNGNPPSARPAII